MWASVVAIIGQKSSPSETIPSNSWESTIPLGFPDFTYPIAGSAPGYNAMSEQRFVHFGIDDGYVSAWEDCGKPWPSDSGVLGLIVYQGQLYCGRLGRNPHHLSVMSMLVHQGRLYAGTGVFDWVRARGAGFNPALSHVFVYEGGTEWRDLGQIGESIRVLCMASFNDELYVGLDRFGGGHCFKYNGSKWLDCGAPNGDNVQNLLPHGYIVDLTDATEIGKISVSKIWASLGAKIRFKDTDTERRLKALLEFSNND